MAGRGEGEGRGSEIDLTVEVVCHHPIVEVVVGVESIPWQLEER